MPAKKENPLAVAAGDKHWLVWRPVPGTRKDGTPKLDKQPMDPAGLSRIVDRSKAAVFTLKEAHAAIAAHNKGTVVPDPLGLGYFPRAGSAMVAADLDKCQGPDADPVQAQRLAHLLALDETYIETSPSGSGARVLYDRSTCGGVFQSVEKGGVGLFELDGKFFTVTGNPLNSRPVADAPKTRAALLDWYGQAGPSSAGSGPVVPLKATKLEGDLLDRWEGDKLADHRLGYIMANPDQDRSKSLYAVAAQMKRLGYTGDEFATVIQAEPGPWRDHLMDQSNPERAMARAWAKPPSEDDVAAGELPEWCPEMDDDPAPVQAAPAGPKPPSGAEVDWAALPGLVGALAAHGHARAMKDTRMPSVVGALMTVSALIGPRIRGAFSDREAFGNLYLGMLAPTGVGKEDTITMVQRALDLVPPAERARLSLMPPSAQGLHNALTIFPEVCVLIDEFGRHLQAMNKDRGGHGDGVLTMLLELYSRASGVLPEKIYAKGAKVAYKEVRNPYATVGVVTTQATLKEGLKRSSLTDGSLNRFVYLSAGEEPPAWKDYGRKAAPDEFTPGIEAGIQRIVRARGETLPADTTLTPIPKVHKLRPTAEAINVMLAARDQFHEYEKSREETAPLWNRAYENMRRISVVLAAGECAMSLLPFDGYKISAATMGLARDIVLQSLRLMGAWVDENLGETEAGVIRGRIMRAIQKHADKDGWAPKTKVMRSVTGNDVKSSEARREVNEMVLNEVLESKHGVGPSLREKALLRVR